MFDQRAEGYAKGEGIVTLILKPLADALRDNDPVHAVIINTASNQDGRTPGITLPSKESQQELIEHTYRQIGLDPSETALFEAHGTGTRAGDRIEAEALAQGLRTSERSSANPLNVVSIKTKMGHCEGASGVCGILQAVAALKTHAILPNCNFEVPSDQIKFDEWRIRVCDRLFDRRALLIITRSPPNSSRGNHRCRGEFRLTVSDMEAQTSTPYSRRQIIPTRKLYRLL